MKKLLSIYFLLFVVVFSFAQGRYAEISQKDFKKHISYLASDELKGREPGTPGDMAAAKYIRDKFRRAGLTLLGDNGFQYFDVVKGVAFGENNTLNIADSIYKIGGKYTPLSFSGSDNVDAQVVFVGYGFSINEDTLKWDDYNNVDVTNKWVMMFRADPDLDNPKSAFASYSSDRYKVMNALDQGAAGVLLINSVDFDKQDTLEKLQRRKSAGATSIPVLQIKRIIANQILASNNITIGDLEKWMKEHHTTKSVVTETKISASVELLTQKAQTMNVVGYLEGKSDEYIIIGGHYDHLGMGGESSRTPDTVAVHYGADDNASGTSVVIELAQKIAQKGSECGVLFMAFGAEEMGLLGSNYFTENPLTDLSKAKAMLNFDMMGRLNEDRALLIGGTGTALQMDSLINIGIDSTKYAINKSMSGTGASDHSSFYAKNIPVLFFSTGVHDQYHTPADHIRLINFSGITELSNDILQLIQLVLREDQELTFQKVDDGGTQGVRRSMKVTLGIVPDFASQVEGVGVAGVREGRPAANGGIIKGDIIVAMEGKAITNIYDYMFRMGKFEKGQLITVEVKRGVEKKVLIITL